MGSKKGDSLKTSFKATSTTQGLSAALNQRKMLSGKVGAVAGWEQMPWPRGLTLPSSRSLSGK